MNVIVFGGSWVIGNGRNCYRMISVFDCVSACIAAIEHGCPNKEYNLGSKSPPSVEELMKGLIEDADSRSVFVKTPGKLVKMVLMLLGILGIDLMYKEQYMIADEDYILDVSETEKDLNWTPRHNDRSMIAAAYKNYIERG
jgi:dTDP-glucose 4,6-dehydratase